MELLFKETAKEDLIYWKKNNPKILKRINELLLSIKNDPYSGIGKPEALKYELSGYWSRRINKEHRLLYKVEDNYIGIYALRYHYEYSITPYETHQLHLFYFCRCNMSRLYHNFQLSTFNSIETHQLHRVYFCRCNVSRLYIKKRVAISHSNS